MSEPTDLDIRIGALQEEYGRLVAAPAHRAATLAAELASVKAQLGMANEMVKAQAEEIEKLKTVTPADQAAT